MNSHRSISLMIEIKWKIHSVGMEMFVFPFFSFLPRRKIILTSSLTGEGLQVKSRNVLVISNMGASDMPQAILKKTYCPSKRFWNARKRVQTFRIPTFIIWIKFLFDTNFKKGETAKTFKLRLLKLKDPSKQFLSCVI